jgi:Intracellular proteinase inhibitor
MLLHALAVAAALVHDSMTLELVLPDTVRAGQAVTLTLRLVNQSRKAATLYSQGRPTAFDIVISHSGGRPVWHRLYRKTITSVLQVRTMAAGEVLEFTDTWNQRDDAGREVPPGEYRVVGILPTDPPERLESRSEVLRITP